ncbi:hypothetical protein [Cyanobium sp. WKJ7-Wakatipu]|nr:hypothetical protein [Cyanobium sp. WKJ7-Wakatipu]
MRPLIQLAPGRAFLAPPEAMDGDLNGSRPIGGKGSCRFPEAADVIPVC